MLLRMNVAAASRIVPTRAGGTARAPCQRTSLAIGSRGGLGAARRKGRP